MRATMPSSRRSTMASSRLIFGSPTKSATNWFAGSSKISSGVPNCWMMPWSMTAIRSARLRASSWSCVTTIVVYPNSRCSTLSSRRTRWRWAASAAAYIACQELRHLYGARGRLHAAADVVDGLLGQAHSVEGVEHDHGAARRTGRVRSRGTGPAPRPAPENTSRCHVRRAIRVTTCPDRPGRTSRSRAGPPSAGLRLTSPVTNWVCDTAVAARNAVSSRPITVTLLCSHCSSRMRWPYSPTARITVPSPLEVGRDPGHVAGVLPDPAGVLGPGPLGQHRPGPDRRRALRPGPLPAQRLLTAPHPLEPHQGYRRSAGGQVPYPPRPAVVQGGQHPAVRAAGQRVGGLDQQLELTAAIAGGQDSEPGQPQRRGPQPAHRAGRGVSCGQRTTGCPHLGPVPVRVLVDYGSCGPRPASHIRLRFVSRPRLPRSMTKSLPNATNPQAAVHAWWRGAAKATRVAPRCPAVNGRRQRTRED